MNGQVPRAPLAELNGAVKRFGNKTALAGVDLAIRPGELVALLGPNGAGKTTAVRLLLGLLRPDAGTALLFSRDPSVPEARQRMGALLQISKVPETLTPREHLRLFASYYPDPLTPAEALAAVGLEDRGDRLFGKLSGGERQRALFALALVGRPDLLVLDEPTVGLDVEARRALWAQTRAQVNAGRSVLLTTHYLEEADALADRVVVIHSGRVVAQGTPQHIKSLAAGRRIRARSRLPIETVQAISGVTSVRRDGEILEILTPRAEGVTAALLAADRDLMDLEITSAGLEEAFLALTRNPVANAGEPS